MLKILIKKTGQLTATSICKGEPGKLTCDDQYCEVVFTLELFVQVANMSIACSLPVFAFFGDSIRSVR